LVVTSRGCASGFKVTRNLIFISTLPSSLFY
jgi:hypothetical protein